MAVYKREGEDKDQKKIEKPHITPIAANRDVASDFLTAIQQSEVKPIAPQFLDFEKDMRIAETGSGIEVLYKQNETNDLFRLIYCWDFGTENDPALSVMSEYLWAPTPTRRRSWPAPSTIWPATSASSPPPSAPMY